MKIFNWVHRRFSNNKGGSAEKAKKNGVIPVTDHENQFLVEKNSNVIELWRGGILTIGTFGYDPLKGTENEENDIVSLYQQEEESENEQNDEEVENEEEEEEVNPLIFAAYTNDFKGLMEMKLEGNNCREESDHDQFRKKERITLADLFSADSDDKVQKTEQQPMNKDGIIITKEKPNCKNDGDIDGKKLFVDQEARIIKKLNQMMRRMLKRKIHPELTPLNSKVSVKKLQNDDYASLLPTQDANI